MAYHPFRHLGLKVISVTIAVALWFLVAGEQTVERSLRAPLELQNMPEQLVLVDNPPPAVDVRVRGTAGVLRELSTADVVAVLDLSAARPGRRLFHLTTENVRTTFGVEVTQVSPGTIPLVFERSGSRTVPVEPNIEGEPDDGYGKGEVRTDPATVEVTGPESALRDLRVAITEPVSIDGARRPVRESATIGVADPRLRLREPRSALVTVDIYPIPVQRAVLNVPVRFRNVGRGLSTQSVVPSVVNVLVRGNKEVLDALPADAVSAFVDLAGLGPGRYNLSVRVEPSQDFEVVRITPPTARVRLVR
ncbi:MAG TPA: CdaR family protein [Vicinamibacterales bacterium]|nr:CdaR family protein [Vicinamibacterales bacterium]